MNRRELFLSTATGALAATLSGVSLPGEADAQTGPAAPAAPAAGSAPGHRPISNNIGAPDDAEPVAPNDTAQGRAQNRRIEITLAGPSN